jgi:ABC-type Na+ transport system ATPase subunit NatA
MLNPFSYNFFNPVMQYFVCDSYTPLMTTVQWTLTFTHLTLGLILFCAVIKLEERSFLRIFKADEEVKSSEDMLRDIEDCSEKRIDGRMI